MAKQKFKINNWAAYNKALVNRGSLIFWLDDSLHLAVDAEIHEVIYANLSLNKVTDAAAFPGLIRQTHRKVRVACADGTYDTKLYYDEL